ncbi:MsnO8 family LLM class oxidoreductase [Labedella phragmitis]|uniref:MsnO8 family LLM class oxidoreductase n=1 Tax=Labedella phragmitis TaxID=2498849 RepID=A0A3S4DDK0_9MICO|nr:MsnO8 family LLM class oxidoreductase [Labedella phragmitis]RWZ46515.1 MsnO8 family LLM class oxidoreductase [Labedella phragmitis]
MRLSVLDLVSVRSRQTTAEALAASLALVDAAERLGYERYWFAEHHNMASVASTNPAILIALAAARTERIRLGSGGVMLPNHAALVIAEQFALLEASAPGRIDLGLGRAPGSDPVVSAVLSRSGPTTRVDGFPDAVADLIALLSGEGAQVRLTSGEEYSLRATPAAVSLPTTWLLGSSDYSAMLAAQLGLPYVFAHHFAGAGGGAERAVDLYRSRFQPSELLDAPRTFVTASVVVADTAEEAAALALPQLQLMARLRTGGKLGPLPTVEEAATAELTAVQQEFVDQMRRSSIVGDPASAATALRDLAARFGVDEIMIAPSASEHEGTAAASSPARERTLELLAAEFSVASAAGASIRSGSI